VRPIIQPTKDELVFSVSNKFVKRFHINHNGFKQQQLRDNIKMEYCRDNNIPLIIIDNIEDIVDKLQHLINI
jgi:hypothetical protein